MSSPFAISRHPLLRRLVKYASVSAISTSTSLTILGALVGIVGMAPVWANLVATAVGTIPSFELNRRWVWSLSGQRIRAAQVIPFSLLSFSGLIVSSLAVRVAGGMTIHDGRLLHTAAVEAGNFGAYGGLWVVQFLLCDRLLFRTRRSRSPAVMVASAAAGSDACELGDTAGPQRGSSCLRGRSVSQAALGGIARDSQNSGVY